MPGWIEIANKFHLFRGYSSSNPKVIPIPKPGRDLSHAKNYRPISLQNSRSKIFERIIVKRMNDHLTLNNTLPDEQFGLHYILRTRCLMKINSMKQLTNEDLRRISTFVGNNPSS